MSEHYIVVTTDQSVATIALNRPEVMNALDDTMVMQLEDAFRALERDAAMFSKVLEVKHSLRERILKNYSLKRRSMA